MGQSSVLVLFIYIGTPCAMVIMVQKGISTGAGAQSSHLIHKQRERETHAGNGVRFYFYLFVCLLLAFRDRFSLCSNPNCSGNSSCRASWT